MSDLIDRQAAIDAVNEYLRLSEVSKTVQSMTSIQAVLRWLPPAEPLTEEDYIELRDRFGGFVVFVVRDMISGKGERWGRKI